MEFTFSSWSSQLGFECPVVDAMTAGARLLVKMAKLFLGPSGGRWRRSRFTDWPGPAKRTFRPAAAPKAPELQPKELDALRDVSNHRAVEIPMLHRLKKLALIEQKSGKWSTTQHGEIMLLLKSVR
jgi:hypothetical protein